MIDTEGYELRRIPWWFSPRTKKQVHIDAYSALSYWREITETDLRAFLRARGFIGEEYLWLEGEFDRRELEEHMGLFRVIPDKPTTIRRYIRRRYIEEELTTYTIVEKLKFLSVFLTFSIETGLGHEPFYAEVTCNSIMTSDLPEAEIDERIRRIVNGTLKLFFIIFDGNKIVRTAKGEHDEDWLVRTLMYLQKYANPVYEGKEPRRGEEQVGGMDGFLEMLMDRIEARDPDEFVTKEALIAIGIEYESSAEFEPEYPRVHVEIEKTRKRHYHDERDIILAPSTDVWIDRILGMVISFEKPK